MRRSCSIRTRKPHRSLPSVRPTEATRLPANNCWTSYETTVELQAPHPSRPQCGEPDHRSIGMVGCKPSEGTWRFPRRDQAVLELISAQPQIGAKAANVKLAGVRRIHLSRIHYYLYYRVRGPPEVVEVLALWHTS